MDQKQIGNRNSGEGSNNPARRQLSLAIVTFTLVFTVGFLITNWLTFVPGQ